MKPLSHRHHDLVQSAEVSNKNSIVQNVCLKLSSLAADHHRCGDHAIQQLNCPTPHPPPPPPPPRPREGDLTRQLDTIACTICSWLLLGPRSRTRAVSRSKFLPHPTLHCACGYIPASPLCPRQAVRTWTQVARSRQRITSHALLDFRNKSRDKNFWQVSYWIIHEGHMSYMVYLGSSGRFFAALLLVGGRWRVTIEANIHMCTRTCTIRLSNWS